MQFLKFVLSAGLCVVLHLYDTRAQEYQVSLPEKINYGFNRFEVIGKCSDGLLVWSAGKNNHTIGLYSETNIKLVWRKQLMLKESGSVNVDQVFLNSDSLIVFYTVQFKGVTVLKAAKMNSQLLLLKPAVVIDTLATTSFESVPELNYEFSFSRKMYLVYYEDLFNGDKRKIHAAAIDNSLFVFWNKEFRAVGFTDPFLSAASISDSAYAYVVIGENQVKNFHNDFPYNKIMILCFDANGKQMKQSVVEESGFIFSEMIIKEDIRQMQMIVCGTYALSPGNRSDGLFLFKFTAQNGILWQKTIPYSDELLSQLTGNFPAKKNDGFYSFNPIKLIVRNDGGIIFFEESFSISSQAFNSPGYGNFGSSSSLTVNFYHYDEILAFSISDSGILEWNTVIHKKQQTEGDGGIFSSFTVMIAPNSLMIVYNDFSSGMDVLSVYNLKPDGTLSRHEIMNAEKKGLLPLVTSARQVSSTDLMLPSLKKGYLQYIKIRI